MTTLTAAMRLIRSAGAEARCSPAYRPDRDPIERLFSEPKAWRRSAAARTAAELIEAMGEAPRAVRPSDIRGWSRLSGYPVQEATVAVDDKPL